MTTFCFYRKYEAGLFLKGVFCMAKFCNKCGSPLDPVTGLCPQCNEFVPSGRNLTQSSGSKNKRNGGHSGGWIALITAVLAVGILLFLLSPDLKKLPFLNHGQSEKEPEIPPQTTVSETDEFTNAYTETPTLPADLPKAGDTVWFGSYPQFGDNDPIEWIVLNVEDDRLLLISRYGLDCRLYHGAMENITWENCSIRPWLNNVFYRTAFDNEQKLDILESDVRADRNPSFGTDPGMDTTDKIFLLSLPEVELYMPSDQDRATDATPYAEDQGAYNRDGCWWLLRTPGIDGKNVASINTDGSIDYDGGSVNSPKATVRPSMWIRWK